MAPQNNLLVRLHKWADDENFMTESLVHLLEYLREYEPSAASELIRRISCDTIQLTPELLGTLKIKTQVHHGNAIPDIELETSQHFVIVEVKCGHHVTDQQLENYPTVLGNSGKSASATRLIFLTRHADLGAGEHPNIRWYEVADWINHEAERISNELSRFLVNQFLDFLKARKMTMEKSLGT